jgi:sulfite exporter TauE/SafE
MQLGAMAGLFLLGLVGSTHCLAMCSAFVVCLSARRGRTRFYQCGRLAAYASLGALAGALGLGQRMLWHQADGRYITMLAGAAMVVLGAALWRGFDASGGLLSESGLLTALQRHLTRPGRRSAFALGNLTGLLPCGLLYAALARSAAASGPLEGGVLMTCFWLGTLPALSLVSSLGPRLLKRQPHWWPRTAAGVTIALGCLTLWHAFGDKAGSLCRFCAVE